MLFTLGYSVLCAVARALPTPVGGGLTRMGARLHYQLAPAKRAAVRTNLRRVLSWSGQETDRAELDQLARRTFQSHSQLLLEWLRDGAGVELSFDGIEHLDRAVAAGRGTVITTCHLGNWEVAAVELARRGHVLHVVTGEQLGRLGAAVRRQKSRRGIHVVRPIDGMRKLYRALGRGEIVVLLVDGDVYRRASQARFFDAATPLPFGAARLARATGAALIPATMVRTTPAHYRVSIQPPVPPEGSDLLVMRAVLRALEPIIAAHPHQWCLFRSLWPHDEARGTA